MHGRRRLVTSELRYHHGYWDGVDREFRGFGMVERIDSEGFADFHRPGDLAFEPVPEEHFSPPVLTKTWFHLGPIGDEIDEPGELDLRDEHWRGDPSRLERPPAMQQLLERLSRVARRDALRSLRGAVLRTELYALDGTARAARPYTVTETAHTVQSLPVGEPFPDHPEEWRTRVFLGREAALRTTRWERGDEPLTRVVFSDDPDIVAHSEAKVAVVRDRAQLAKLWAQKAQLPGLQTIVLMTGEPDGSDTLSWAGFLAAGDRNPASEVDARMAGLAHDDVAPAALHLGGPPGRPRR